MLLVTSPAGAEQDSAELSDTRYGGADRYATSLLIAEAVAAEAGGTLDDVVLVSGRSWTDAVVAAPLAGHLGAAVLATPPGELRADAAEFLERVGVSTARLIGANSDTDGVGPTVVSGLNRLGITTIRASHSDQYTTAALVALEIGTPGDMGNLGATAVVASGEVFADALVAGAFAAHGKHPVLLTPADELHDSAATYLRDLQVEHVVLMGGTAALSADVEASIRALGIDVTRIAGTTRYDTAVKAAELTTGRYGDDCFSTRRVGLARARVPFDSFSAGPLLGQLCAPLLLADPGSIPDDTAAYLDSIRLSAAEAGHETVDLRIFGGDAAVSQAAIDEYLDAGMAAAEPSGVTCSFDLGEKPTVLLGGRFALRPTLSPDCTRVAYLDDEQALWTADLDGSDRVRLTGGYTRDEEDDDPSWSPDGTRIVFSRDTGVWIHDSEPVVHLYVISADGTGETQLTDATATDTSPVWSPDGERIAFERQNLDAEGDDPAWRDRYVVIIDADGSNENELRRGRPRETNPSWSSEGDHIAHHSGGGWWLMRADGSAQRSLPIEATGGERVVWSPSGEHLAYVQLEWLENDRVRHRLVVSTPSGTDRRTVLSYSGSIDDHLVINAPQWTPDSQAIFFERTRNTGGKRQAYVVAIPE